MSIETFRQRAYEKGHIKHLNMTPEKIYKKQVDAIASISNTEGFKEIKEYWRKWLLIQDDELMSMSLTKDPVHMAIVIDRKNTGTKFLSFLENLVDSAQ